MAYCFKDHAAPVVSDAHMPDALIRETVGLFSNTQALRSALRALEGSAFNRHHISIIEGGSEFLSVRTQDTFAEELAQRIMRQHGAQKVYIQVIG